MLDRDCVRLNGPLGRVAQVVATAPRAILIVTGLLVAIGGVFAVGAPGALSPAGYEVPGSESTRVATQVAEAFGAGPPNVVILASADSGSTSIGSERNARAGRAATELIAGIESVREVVSYWDGFTALGSDDGMQALITARIATDEDAVYDRVEDIRHGLDELAADGLTFRVGGSAAANLDVVDVSERDLLRAELLVFPLTTVVLLVVFRSVVAALLPLIVSIVAVVGTAVVLRLLADVTLISIFGLNLASALGLGMAVDYSLFLISRWREERPQASSADEALARAIATAGRSILFSGLTTAATLAALLVFDYPLFRSLAISGFVVVLLATFGALVALPAAMFLLGDRIDAGQIRATRPPADHRTGRWYRLALLIMKRPVAVIRRNRRSTRGCRPALPAGRVQPARRPGTADHGRVPTSRRCHSDRLLGSEPRVACRAGRRRRASRDRAGRGG